MIPEDSESWQSSIHWPHSRAPTLTRAEESSLMPQLSDSFNNRHENHNRAPPIICRNLISGHCMWGQDDLPYFPDCLFQLQMWVFSTSSLFQRDLHEQWSVSCGPFSPWGQIFPARGQQIHADPSTICRTNNEIMGLSHTHIYVLLFSKCCVQQNENYLRYVTKSTAIVCETACMLASLRIFSVLHLISAKKAKNRWFSQFLNNKSSKIMRLKIQVIKKDLHIHTGSVETTDREVRLIPKLT